MPFERQALKAARTGAKPGAGGSDQGNGVVPALREPMAECGRQNFNEV
jgi:hypothetical protein